MFQMLDFQYLPLRNPWPGDGGKQKAPKEPYTPPRKKKKGATAGAAAKRPQKALILLARRRTSFQQEPLLQHKMTRHYSRWYNSCFMSFSFSLQTSKGCSSVHLKQFLQDNVRSPEDWWLSMLLVDMASNYITKTRKHFYNDMKTLKILRGVKIREFFDI
jgi:hypothetical protein